MKTLRLIAAGDISLQTRDGKRPLDKVGEILSFVRSVSEPINSNKLTWGWWFEEISATYLSGNMKNWIIRIRKYGVKHLLPYILWLISPFVIRCYIGFLAKRLKRG